MLTSLVARTSNVRRLHRWRSLAAAAAVVLVSLGGGAAIATALQPGTQPSSSSAMHWHFASSNRNGIHLTVMYRGVESGAEVKANVTGLTPGTVCQLQVVSNQGQVMVLGGWQYWNEAAWYPASTSVAPGAISAFELTVKGKVVASAPS